MRLSWIRAAALGAAAFIVAPSLARADAIDDIDKKITRLEGEVIQLGKGIKKPDLNTGTRDAASRKLVDAQVAFGLGNYDDAAVMLYDYVAKYKANGSYDEALYYLSESLFKKGDLMASRTYFTQLVREVGPGSKFYQQALERLIELSLKLRDDTDVQTWLDALDNVPDAKKRDSVPYVRGKHAYFTGNFDGAIAYFDKIPTTSSYYFQARYFLGGTHVAKRDFVPALRVYSALLKMAPKNKDDRKVAELTHLAMGRVYYECDTPEQCAVALTAAEKDKVKKEYAKQNLSDEQMNEHYADLRSKKLWSRAIDQYLMISRRSEMFDDALYEIAWVYVKNKKYEEALRALELLALADPDATKMPEVRLLEGNLRIRRAQAASYATEGNSVEEYDKAQQVFDTTKVTFDGPHKELIKIIEERADPRAFMAQVTGRTSDTFDVKATMPEVAADWVRRQPDVERVVAIETDLGVIHDDVAEALQTIDRLDAAMSGASGSNVFPALAAKRSRAIEVLEELTGLRVQLADQLRTLVSRHLSDQQRARLDALSADREAAVRAFKELPNAKLSHGERIAAAREEYTDLDKQASEVAVEIEGTEATRLAIAKYVDDMKKAGHKMPDLALYEKTDKELAAEVAAMQKELDDIRVEATKARDVAGTGDELAAKERELRSNLRRTLDAEYKYVFEVSRSVTFGDRQKIDQIGLLAEKAGRMTGTLDEINVKIDEVVTWGLKDVREALDEEKGRLTAYQREYSDLELESREMGGLVLGAAFGVVRDMFYDILVRTDVGVIDIAWAQREFADKTLKSLDRDKKREQRTLRIEFDQVLREEDAAKQKAHQDAAKKKNEAPDEGGDQ
ncbi:MAG TPA: tetratricopeptide repeat protein [Kofleriaceae bacterium]|nr:tetratricopeptide repeat protein [Kofleriaceae bacterium]